MTSLKKSKIKAVRNNTDITYLNIQHINNNHIINLNK